MAKEKKENKFELYFEWWLNDMQKMGLVRKWKKEPESLLMLDPMVIYSQVHFERKESRTVSHNLLNPATYTRDYDVEFHKSLLDVFIGLIVKEEDSYVLKELYERKKADTYYDFSYYYLFNQKEISEDYFTVSFDVKPGAAAIRFSSGLGSSREFPYNQKLMVEKYGIFVNKVIPCKDRNSLFNKTFIPEKYMFTDTGKQLRKLGPTEKVRTIKEWMLSLELKAIPNVKKD